MTETDRIARMTLDLLRQQGLTDQEISEIFACPHSADDAYEPGPSVKLAILALIVSEAHDSVGGVAMTTGR